MPLRPFIFFNLSHIRVNPRNSRQLRFTFPVFAFLIGCNVTLLFIRVNPCPSVVNFHASSFCPALLALLVVMAKKRFLRLIKILSGVQADAESELDRFERFAHFCVLVGRSFVRNRCPVRAAALSYATLLALIPMLAVAISVTSSMLKDQGEQGNLFRHRQVHLPHHAAGYRQGR